MPPESDSSQDPSLNPPALKAATHRVGPECYWLTPFRLTGTIREWIARGFAGIIHQRTNAANQQEDFSYGVIQDELRKYLWENNDTTKILIETKQRFDPRTTAKRPAIVVSRNSYRYMGIIIGDREMAQANLSGSERYTHFLVGSHTVFTISQSPVQAEMLADEVRMLLHQYGKVALREWGSTLKQWAFMEASPLSKLEEAQENFVVASTYGWTLCEAWTIQPQAPLLRGMRIEVNPTPGVILEY